MSATGPMRTDGAEPYSGERVDLERGLISRDIFTSTAIYEQEQERVFARSWLFVGHESQIAEPGDFVLGRMGEESVILNRDRDGRIHVLLNNCRHRGMRVCRYDPFFRHVYVRHVQLRDYYVAAPCPRARRPVVHPSVPFSG